MQSKPCPLCYQFHLDLVRVETELEFLLEGMPKVDQASLEGARAMREFRRVEAALDRIETEYFAHRNEALQHQLEDRVALN